MVERMHKVSVLMLKSDSDAFMQLLQDAGVVHIEHGDFAESQEIVDLKIVTDRCKKAFSLISRYADVKPYNRADKHSDPMSLVEATEQASIELRTLATEQERIARNIKRVEPWGVFDPALIVALRKRGVSIQFYAMSPAEFGKTDFGDCHIEVISEEQKVIRFVVLNSGSDTLADIPQEEFPLENLLILRDELSAVEGRLRHREACLSAYYKQREILARRISELEDTMAFLLAGSKLTSEVEGEVLRLSGFVPKSGLKGLETLLDNEDVVYIVDRPEKDDAVPVKLRNGPFARLFEPITKIFGLPTYTEMDTTPFFAPFFAFFFGFCLADIGYGAIVVVATLVGYFVLKAKAAKRLALLGFILGVMTLVGGLILDTVFGVRISDVNGVPEGIRSLIFFGDIDAAMYFAIALGVVQVLFGFILQTVNVVRRDGFQAGLQPIGTFLLITGILIYSIGGMGSSFAIGPIPVGRVLNAAFDPKQIGLISAVAGLALILLFNNVSKKIWIRPLLGIWEMYGIASGVPGDILSYIRLFALGLAGSLLGGAINQIALMVRGDDPGIISVFFMILVLIGGHALNFALAALGAFVHPLRLTFVEFYKAVGFNGGGKPYTPFARHSNG